MSVMNEVVRKCCNCGFENSFVHFNQTKTFGTQDLDTRPAPLQRENIKYNIERCNNCNYVNENIEEKIEFDKSILTSDRYLKILNSSYPMLAKEYILASMIKESIEDYTNASKYMLYACWALDDNEIDAKKLRKIAAKLFEKVEDYEAKRIIIIDLYRRAEDFEKASSLILDAYGFINDNYIKKILQYEEDLIDNKDSHCHDCSEVDDFIGEDINEEELADSIEEVERKLFDENSNEPIRLMGKNGLITLEQVALIPLEYNGHKNLYAILHPTDIAKDEALVFLLIGKERLEDLEVVKNEEEATEVFKIYYKMLGERGNK